MTQVYISVDVETDGPIPGVNSMLSLGAAAMTDERSIFNTFSVNFELAKDAEPDPDTMRWWSTQPAAWEVHRQNLWPVKAAMEGFDGWVRLVSPDTLPVFVGYPAGFDFTFVYWYFMRYLGSSPFLFSALDIKSYAAGKLGMPYSEVSKASLAAFLPKDRPHTHVATEDAIEQGLLFLNLMRVPNSNK